MSADITDAMFTLEFDLAKYPEPGDPNRALVMRRAFQSIRSNGWQEGYTDGMQDGRDKRAEVSGG